MSQITIKHSLTTRPNTLPWIFFSDVVCVSVQTWAFYTMTERGVNEYLLTYLSTYLLPHLKNTSVPSPKGEPWFSNPMITEGISNSSKSVTNAIFMTSRFKENNKVTISDC